MLNFFPKFLCLSAIFQGALAVLAWKTFDISSLLLEESKNVRYRDPGGNTKPLETIIKENGANSVKIRVWVNPPDGTCNLDYALKLGARAQAAGLRVVLNLHYSDGFADPGRQATPAAWAKFTTDALIAQVETYTKDVMNAFANRGIPVELVSIGNEIRAGLLWPVGSRDNVTQMGSVLAAGIRGVKASLSNSSLIMLHLDQGYSWEAQKSFYDSLATSKTFSMDLVDVQSVTYHPFWSTDSTLENFKNTVDNMARTYRKRIVVMETDWPVRCSNPRLIPPSLLPIEFSVSGQVSWMQKVADVLSAVPDGFGVGLMYWEPGWINNAVLGSICEDNVLFDGDWSDPNAVVAKARKSINMMANL